jgi:hypothetical protein
LRRVQSSRRGKRARFYVARNKYLLEISALIEAIVRIHPRHPVSRHNSHVIGQGAGFANRSHQG